MPTLKHVEGSLTTNKLRCMRSLLAKLHELQIHELCGSIESHDAQNLAKKVARNRYLPIMPGRACQIRELQRLILVQEQSETQGAIDKWKHRLRNSTQACYRWVRPRTTPPTYNLCHDHEQAIDSPETALQCLRDFWNSIWHRPLPQPDQLLATCFDIFPGRPDGAWNPLTAYELYGSALKQAGSSAVLTDGQGMIASIPVCVWEDLLPFYHQCENQGIIPDHWREIRQVHICKAGKAARLSDHNVFLPNLGFRPS